MLVAIADLDSRTAVCSVSESAQGLIDEGRRAVLFQGGISWSSTREDATWNRVRFRGVGRGDESRLLRNARLYLDADGGGAFDDADEPLGDPVPAIPPDDAIEFVFFRAMPDGAAETYFLVAEVTSPRPASEAAIVPGIAALALAIGAGFRGRRRAGRARGISLALAAAAVLAAVSFAACDGGHRASREVQFAIEEASDMGLQGARSGVSIVPEGLPLLGPAIDV